MGTPAPVRVYHVGSETFNKPGLAFDRARTIARQLATVSGRSQFVDVVRSDGNTVRLRGYLDSRGQAHSIIVPQAGRRW